MLRNCVICGGEFAAQTVGRPRKYCSTNCKSRARNTEKKRENDLKWRTKHATKLADKTRQWRDKSPEKTREHTIRWRRNENLEMKLARNQRRNARISAALRLLREIETNGMGAFI